MARITGSHLNCRALQLECVKNTFGLAGGLSITFSSPNRFRFREVLDRCIRHLTFHGHSKPKAAAGICP
jgi:hypothetical protein